ncbi:hypothetical protein ACGFXB_43755 [Streptomyces canus]|uniref:hypothetical protein n=1 Tax=Streptomyces canus TaxID=58343 RepID=UPI0037229C31
MTFVDFQIDAQRFLAAQRTYLRRLAACPPAIPAVDGVQIVLDRIDVGPSSLRHDQAGEFDVFYVDHGDVVGSRTPATGFLTKLAQQLTLQFTTDAQIRDHANADPPLVAWPVTVVYDLSAFALDEECYLRADPDSVEFGSPPALPVPLPPAVVAMLRTYVSTQLRVLAPSGTVPMGLAGLKLPSGFLNAGITVDTSGQTLAIRVQIRASQDPMWAAWTNFYRGAIDDRRLGRDWAVFVPARYLTSRIINELWQAIPKDDDLESYPGASYAVDGGRATIDIDVLLIYHAVKVEALDLDITVEGDPHVRLSLWVEQRNGLSALIDYGGLVNPVGVLSTLAVALIDAMGIPARAILYRIVGSAIVDGLKGEPVDSVTQPSDTSVRIDKRVVPPSITGVAMPAVTDLLAHPDGVALAGSLQVTEPSNAVATVLGIRQLALQVPPVNCGAADMVLVALFGSDPGRFEILGGGADIGNLGTAPLRLCSPPTLLLDDGSLPPLRITTDDVALPIDVSFGLGLPSPDYYSAHLPFEILVRTNAGTRMIRLDPPPVITDADLKHIQAGLLVAIGDCQQLVDPWFKHHRGYNPRWSPRPPEDLDVLHHWEVVVSGLPAGEELRLQDPSGNLLASAVSSDPRVSVQASAVVAPSLDTGREVGILRVGPEQALDSPGAEAGADGPALGIEVRQTNLVIEGELPLAQPTHGIGLTTLDEKPVLITLLSDRAEALDVLSGAPAVPVAEWSGQFTGMIDVPGATLLFGAAGVSRLDRTGTLTATTMDTPVLHAASGSSGLVLVTPDRVLSMTNDLQPVRETARSGVTGVAVVGREVLLGNAAGIEALDERLEPVARSWVSHARVTRSGAIVSLVRASGLRRGTVLATLEDGRAALMARHGDQVAEVAEFADAPLLAGAVRIGSALVIVSDTPDRLRVLRVGPTVSL